MRNAEWAELKDVIYFGFELISQHVENNLTQYSWRFRANTNRKIFEKILSYDDRYLFIRVRQRREIIIIL
jgi:hypothetical protein